MTCPLDPSFLGRPGAALLAAVLFRSYVSDRSNTGTASEQSHSPSETQEDTQAPRATQARGTDMPTTKVVSADKKHGSTATRSTNQGASNDQGDDRSLGTITKARSSTCKARRVRQVWTPWRWPRKIWVGFCYSFIVFAIVTAYVECSRSQSEKIQKFCDLVPLAGAGVVSLCAWMLSMMKQLPQHLPEIQFASRTSSRVEIGDELGKVYASLSQAIATSDSLFKVPSLIGHKRADAMRFQLREGSFTTEHLQLFLQQSSDMDEDLLRLILQLGRVGSFALRQQHRTNEKINRIRQDAYWEFYPLVFFRGTSTSEAELQIRLKEHFTLLSDEITEADIKTRNMILAFVMLTSTTESIRKTSIEDQLELLRMKEEMASQWDWFVRFGTQVFWLPEPEDIAQISKNVELAQSIHDWSHGVLDLLERVMIYLKYAKSHIQTLMEITNPGGTIKWELEDKDQELAEFLAQISHDFMLISHNTQAWMQIQMKGLI